MLPSDPRPDVSTADLVKEALVEGRLLLRTELSLARDEMRQEAKGFLRGAIAFGAALAMGGLGIAMLLIGFALAIAPHSAAAWIIGGVLIVAAVVAALIGMQALPKKPFEHTRERLETDLHLLKETTA
jgi:uncharacterized membrane protein YqjE